MKKNKNNMGKITSTDLVYTYITTLLGVESANIFKDLHKKMDSLNDKHYTRYSLKELEPIEKILDQMITSKLFTPEQEYDIGSTYGNLSNYLDQFR